MSGGGIPITSLQDLLLLREIRNQPSAMEVGLQSFVKGIGDNIMKQREEAEAKKKQEESFANAIKLKDSMMNNTNAGKIKMTMDSEGKYNFTIESPDTETEKTKPPKKIYGVNTSKGTMREIGEVPAGSEVFSQPLDADSIALREQAKNEQKRIFEAVKRSDTYVADANQVLTGIDNIMNQVSLLPNYERGVFNQVGANIDVLKNKFAKEETLNKYLITVSQELIPMARKLMEEKGPITEFDVARVEKGLGDITSPTNDKIFALEQLKNKVIKAIEIKRQEALNPGSSFEDFDLDMPQNTGVPQIGQIYNGQKVINVKRIK